MTATTDTLLILTVTALAVIAEAATDTPCTEKLFESGQVNSTWVTASSEQRGKEARLVSSGGWCANELDTDKYIEIQFPQSVGIKGLITGPLADGGSYPMNIRVQYTPRGGTFFQDLPQVNGTMEIHYDGPNNRTKTFTQGIAMDRIRLALQQWSGDPCLTLELLGCPIADLCLGGCDNGGVCVMEDICNCPSGYTGSRCEIQECTPRPLGLSDGRIPVSMVTVSSEDARLHRKDQIGNAPTKTGWCPLASDPSPWVEIKLTKPMAVSDFNFMYPIRAEGEEKMYMQEFELKYIAPSDSSKTFRTFANHIPSLNGTHYFQVRTIPSVVTDTIRIEPDSVVTRGCFKLEIHGCDPKSLCSTDWCENGGSCMGENVCACPSGYFGDRCHETKTYIKETNFAFLTIEHNVIQTASINFLVFGHVILVPGVNSNAVQLVGTNSYIKLNQSTTSTSCLSDIDLCKSGFTFAIDINFGRLLDNTFIVSSGGNLPDHKGLALYYNHNTLVYIVSTGGQTWQMSVTYHPIISVWQHFEITWNKNLGLGLFLDGHLLGTHGRPAPKPATQTVELCIGCSHTEVNVQINMTVKGFHMWNLDRTALVNAGIKPAPVQISTPATTVESTKLTTIPKGTTQHTIKTSTTPSTTFLASTAMSTIASNTKPTTKIPTKITATTTTTLEPTTKTVTTTTTSEPITKTVTTKTKSEPTTKSAKTTTTSIPITKTGTTTTTSEPITKTVTTKTTSEPTTKTATTTRTSDRTTKTATTTTTSEPTTKTATTTTKLEPTSKTVTTATTTKPTTTTQMETKLTTTKLPVTAATQMAFSNDSTQTSTTTQQTTNQLVTTERPVTTYTWNLTDITHNHVSGNNYTLTVHGGVTVRDGGLEISNSSQYIDFGITHKVECLLNPAKCMHGLTVQFKIKFTKLDENTYLLTSGGERPDGIGLAVVYLYGHVQIVVSTNQRSWFASCGRETVFANGYHNIMISWQQTTGLYVYVDNRLVDSTDKPMLHPVTSGSATHVYFGKSSVSVTSSQQVKYIIKAFTIWHATLDILIQKGIYKPPITDKPTTVTVKQTTRAPTTTSATPITTKTIAPPPPNTASPTVKPATPTYTEKPSVHPIVGNDGHGYIACTFAGAAEQNVEFMVSLVVDGKVVIDTTVNGNTGIAMFAVADVDENLYNTKIQCSIKGRFVGNTVTTKTTISNVLVPRYEVSPSRLTVTEGHSAGHVTVTSTAPPQFYCCRGCKGECQVHIAGTFHYDRHDQKCGKQVIAQAVVQSTTPPHYNKPICGFALTISNWKLANTISVKATLDGRRDRDHTNTLSIQARVYNQPTAAPITVQPTSIQIATVAVTSKDIYHHSSMCKSLNDPHMTTFDGQGYDNMHTGEFILYRHTTLPFEVRVKYQQCKYRSRVSCNCAVSVKSGDDIITITGCPSTSVHGSKRLMTIQIYKNGQLTPGTSIRRYGSGQKFKIELPTGTVVTVQQSFKPFVNVWIKASGPDWGHTSGLCGSYDGNRRNDLSPSTAHHIVHWKADVRSTFFHGVSASSQTIGANYCSCVQGKDSICIYGMGAITCGKSRHDITDILMRQALRPANTRHRRQTQANTTEIVDAFEQQDTNITKEEAIEFCQNAIVNSTVTESCKPILTSNVTQQIENCAHDYEVTGSKVWASDALRDIVVDCIEEARMLTDLNMLNDTANATAAAPEIPDNITAILSNLCLEDCGKNGKCAGGICECNDGYSGISCDISKETTPTVSPGPFLCDKSQASDCTTASVFGDDFVNSADLTCHYEYITVRETIVRKGTKQAVAAAYISLNQIVCTLPSATSAYIQVSNDGRALSDAVAVHVVYDSVCHDCTVDLNNTVSVHCSRTDGNCEIDGACHVNGATKTGETCLVCRPDASTDAWSSSNAVECIKSPLPQDRDDDDMDQTEIIILAVVCAVFGALLIIGIIYIVRLKTGMAKKNKKSEMGQYEVTDMELHNKDKETKHDYDNPSYHL